MKKYRLPFQLSLNGPQVFFALACLSIIIKISGKIFEAAKTCQKAAFVNPDLVASFLVVLLVNVVLLILARHWSKILRIPMSFLFLILPFAFYFLLLINSLLFCWNDHFFLWGVFFCLLAWTWISRNDSTPQVRRLKEESWGYWFIGLFILQGFLLFFSQNFRTDRLAFADENTFWYVAAKAMLDKGFLSAHQMSYPGGGLHPLGVPFLNAFPGILVNFSSPAIPFFMPIFILIGFALVLSEFVRPQLRWGLIFFLAVWFASLNNRSWVGNLFYSMVYGESVSMVLVLSLLNWLVLSKSELTCRFWGLSGFLIGLLALTKFPLILFSVVFFIAFVIGNWPKIQNLKKLLVMIACFLVPFLVLKMFQMKFGGTVASLGGEGTLLEHLFSPNGDMLKRVVSNIAVDAGNLGYYFFVAALFSLFFYQQLSYGWPIVVWVLFLVIYYAYFYSYGFIGGGDAASGLRYFLPAVAGFFLLGANGFSKWINWIDRRKSRWLQLVLYSISLSIIFYKFF
ncbi:MAG: hypothetical protein HQL24_05825 [Candidatus Omnitrophica bacterium]|nr:hypothetical protein [Candidatus Omnitrophota bacterium]